MAGLRRQWWGRVALILIGLGGCASARMAWAADAMDTAILRGMDKITGRVMQIEMPIGVTIHYGTLELVVRTCRKRPPEETPEAAAFLDISEVRNNEPAVNYFRGWMFASSPALSAMEHPIYDIWLLDCADSTAGKTPAGKTP